MFFGNLETDEMGDAGGVREHVASIPTTKRSWNWTFEKHNLGVFLHNSDDGVVVARQGVFFCF